MAEGVLYVRRSGSGRWLWLSSESHRRQCECAHALTARAIHGRVARVDGSIVNYWFCLSTLLVLGYITSPDFLGHTSGSRPHSPVTASSNPSFPHILHIPSSWQTD